MNEWTNERMNEWMIKMSEVSYRHRQLCSLNWDHRDIWRDRPSPQTTTLSDFGPARHRTNTPRWSTHTKTVTHRGVNQPRRRSTTRWSRQRADRPTTQSKLSSLEMLLKHISTNVASTLFTLWKSVTEARQTPSEWEWRYTEGADSLRPKDGYYC